MSEGNCDHGELTDPEAFLRALAGSPFGEPEDGQLPDGSDESTNPESTRKDG